MSDRNLPDPQPETNTNESFSDLLSQYERDHARVSDAENRRLQGTVVAVTDDSVLLDIGYKTEGILPLTLFQSAGETVKPGDQFPVSITGRDPEGYYQLTRFKVARPKDWTSLERAFAEKSAIVGTVTARDANHLSTACSDQKSVYAGFCRIFCMNGYLSTPHWRA